MSLNWGNLFIIVFTILILITSSASGYEKNKESHSGQIDEKEDPPKEQVLVWDQKTLKKVSSGSGSYNGYARLIQLDNGELICAYESDGNIVTTRSSNEGQTWSPTTMIAVKASGVNMTVPDILKLADGSLLAMYNRRPYEIHPSRRFGISIKKSVDNGETWGAEKIIYEAGYQFENGCWEPAAVQLPNGQIQLFFANEGPYTGSSEQNISLLRSNDLGETWTVDPEIVSFRAGSRDGMPVPLLLQGSDEVIVAIEDNGKVNFKPYIIRNNLIENWAVAVGPSHENRQYALATRVDDAVYAGAPYIRQLSTGETILSYQGTENRKSNALHHTDMKVVVGDMDAKNFKGKTAPFKIPLDKSALWNSISVLNDDEIVALTSTNAFNNEGRTEVWMIKGRIK